MVYKAIFWFLCTLTYLLPLPFSFNVLFYFTYFSSSVFADLLLFEIKLNNHFIGKHCLSCSSLYPHSKASKKLPCEKTGFILPSDFAHQRCNVGGDMVAPAAESWIVKPSHSFLSINPSLSWSAGIIVMFSPCIQKLLQSF
jgi:hypothetical protein